jgi:hypothetical protein
LTDPLLSFNIHDAIRLRTNLWFANLPEYFRVDSVTPNFTFERVDRLDLPDRREIRRRIGYTAYDLGDDELLVESAAPVMSSFGTKAKWKVFVSGLAGDSTRIVTSVPYFSFKPVRFKARQMLSKLARLVFMIKLIRRGLAVCHATALSKGEDAHLFIGFSGTGKSTIASTLMGLGYDFLTDDFSIVDPYGAVYCYPDWHESHEERSGLGVAKYLVHTPSHSVEGLRIRARAAVKSIVFVERGPDAVVELDEAEAIRRIELVNAAENSRVWNSPVSLIVNQYAYFFPDLDLEGILTRYRDSVRAFVRQADRYVTLRFSSSKFQDVDRLLSRV